ncbi:hypothetical protein Tco_1043755 [Tanacetum coccineum]|uniref:Uncharacterized protein n=1 Tax=Tanacetum coccineum TaxID=301880 RepID=A0ABQ5GMZ3_9ASTR
MPSITFSEPSLVAEIDSVFSCIKSFPKGTSYGIDGLRAQHILDALCGEGSATATDLLKVTHMYSLPWGVQQGDPLATSSFFLILHRFIHKSKGQLQASNLTVLDLDVGIVTWRFREVVRVLRHYKGGIGPGQEAVMLLGGVVSRDADFISGLAMRRATNAVDLISLLPQLHDPQSELLLLRSCMGIAKLFFVYEIVNHIDKLSHGEEGLVCLTKVVRASNREKYLEGPILGATRPYLRDSGICGMDDDYVSALIQAIVAFGNPIVQSDKYTEKNSIENQHVFIPFEFESFGFLAPDVVELLSRIQWVMHNNFMTPRSADVKALENGTHSEEYDKATELTNEHKNSLNVQCFTVPLLNAPKASSPKPH